MTREEKTALIEELKQQFLNNKFFYITDCSTMTVAKVNQLRRSCFEKGIKLQVAKNKLIKKALEWAGTESGSQYNGLFEALHGSSALMFCETGNVPAKLIKEFRGTDKNATKPALKAAYIDSAVFLGEESLDSLTSIKSKEDLLGDLIGLLQAPMQRLLGALQSGGNTIAGVLKTLEERGN